MNEKIKVVRTTTLPLARFGMYENPKIFKRVLSIHWVTVSRSKHFSQNAENTWGTLYTSRIFLTASKHLIHPPPLASGHRTGQVTSQVSNQSEFGRQPSYGKYNFDQELISSIQMSQFLWEFKPEAESSFRYCGLHKTL